ncbi:MAG: multidrug efflux system outer membrane protein, partial [Gammaproteobacteria bacterium]
MKYFISKFCVVLAAVLVAGCTITGISPDIKEQDLPGSWNNIVEHDSVNNDWLTTLGDEALVEQVAIAMKQNYQLATQAARVEEARQGLIISGAARYPELSLSLDASRRRSIINETASTTGSNFAIGLDLAFEIDVWGKLGDAAKQASLNLLAQEALYKDAQHNLAANVARAWFNVISANQSLTLFQERLANLKVDMDIIERAYRQGLNTSLDVYLTRATVAQERARIAQQQQLLSENKVALQLLLADYPNGQLAVNKTLAVLDEAIPLGLPSELVSRRPDLQQSWMNLLAADAGLAIAHKQRFPRLSLVASGSDVSSEIGSLLNGSTLAWSLLGNLTQPVFNAGRLKALEEQARSRVIQLEKLYLDSLFLAFSEVENAISRNAALAEQYQATLASEKNAVLALTLAFEQYQRGLVTYTTVLESQRRAFDAQSTVIDLRNQLLQNRIT